MVPRRFAVVLLAAALFGHVVYSGSDAVNRIGPELRQMLAASSVESRLPVVIKLSVPEPNEPVLLAHADGRTRLQFFRQRAESLSGLILSTLQRAEAQGLATRVRLLWIADAVSVTVAPELVPSLAQLRGVRWIELDAALGAEMNGDQSGPNPNATVTPPLLGMHVDAVWSQGITGKNVVIAQVDTGVFRTHPDLSDHIWVNSDEIDGDGSDNDGNGYIDDVRGWDFMQNDADPQDGDGHGTLVAGLAVGDGHAGTQTGAAPDAELMILRRGTTHSSVWEAEQYAIDNGADILLSAFSVRWSNSPRPDYATWRDIADRELAAGVIHVNAAGNTASALAQNPVPYNVNAPANCPSPFLHSAQTMRGGRSSVIAVANVDAGNNISGTSSIGPAEWTDIVANVDATYPYSMPTKYRDYPYLGGTGQGLLKPDIAAYGDGSTATALGGGYGTLNGTSAASGHLAGVTALLLEARPTATPAQVTRALFETAVDRGPAGWDTLYGEGVVHAANALQRLTQLVDVCAAQGGDPDTDDVCAAVDNCPGQWNPTQSDQDADGTGDLCDGCPNDAQNDVDADGHCCPADNCCLIPNSSQRDIDRDAVGDACDTNPVLRVSNDSLETPDFGTIQAAVNAATESGTQIDISPGLGPYLESVRVDRLMTFTFRASRPSGSTAPVIVDGGTGPAFDVVSSSGTTPVTFSELSMRGMNGLRTAVATRLERVSFQSISGTALLLTAGNHRAESLSFDSSVSTGIDVRVGASLTMQRSSLRGMTADGVLVAGSIALENTLIAAGSARGVVIAAGGTATVRFSTIADNVGVGVEAVAGGSVTIDRSIAFGNGTADLVNVACTNANWSDIGVPNCSGVNNCISVSPMFDSNFGIGDGSGCLDHGPPPSTFTGTPCFDLAGGPRLRDFNGDGLAQSDPGAYERRNELRTPGETTQVRWSDLSHMSWDATPGAVEYHVTRGSVGLLSYAYSGDCRDDLDPDRSDTTLTDAGIPTAGASFFYTILAESSTSQHATSGYGTCAERSAFNACP